MTDVTYAIVFNGEIVDGFQVISVKAHLAKMLKASPEKMQVLFSGKPVVLKRTTDKAEAAKYGSALKRVGANVKVKIIRSEAEAEPKAQTPDTAPGAPVTPVATPDTSNLSLAPNEGRLVEPAPPPAAPNLDLSNMSLADNDGSPLVEPKPEVKAEVDVSNLSVADNDGAPLAEPKPQPAKREAPDFGLDEPGAVLETVKEAVEEVHPDTSGLSLAFPGSDLLEPEERDQGPPPSAPDTSKLSVVSNRATFDT